MHKGQTDRLICASYTGAGGGGAMVLCIFAVPFELHVKGQGPTSLAVDVDGGYSDFFFSPSSYLSYR